MLETDLEVCTDGLQWLNGKEFLSKYRVTRDQLNMITGLINGAEALKTKQIWSQTNGSEKPTYDLPPFCGTRGHDG